MANPVIYASNSFAAVFHLVTQATPSAKDVACVNNHCHRQRDSAVFCTIPVYIEKRSSIIGTPLGISFGMVEYQK